MEKPFAPSCERNQGPILETIQPWLVNTTSVLEISSGTGQHAVFLATAMPHLIWQTSDLAECHEGINAWINESGLSNIKAPLSLDALDNWPAIGQFDAVFISNSLHIMSKEAVASLFKNLPKVLQPKSQLCIYGPFNIDGQFTSESNANFEQWLKDRDPRSGIRDLEWIIELAELANLSFCEAVDMPANNKLLRFLAK